MYAIIRTGGKQYRVQENETIIVEKLAGDADETVTIDDVLFVGGETTKIGTPTVAGATVQATIVKQGKGPKIHGYTYVKVKGEQRHYGHRQEQTTLRIDKIAA
ncbi:MAG: 50S ribosomal protein L21 [Armatimonadetes bacterium]|nr:50S ribosomal protein L21 [Armatimonadota bacterium]